ncbi:LD-carboxypeptidase [Parvibium lacunae]|uniref:Muramoyltetrapeptide carboxypeptidase n=1 Tax=Parvibium lacunae TaxID=1888893 RepID=A0A368L7C3_9BURK|nr:LD-carboxypeptidase [Parvibium lacunae]RCS59526.1 muramoyltetrapeptide carboxypeptidase [Parvibium lacunae]
MTAPALCFFSPSGSVQDADALQRAASFLQEQGYALSYQPHTLAQAQRFAGDDKARLTDLHSVFESHYDIAIATRGGYGLTRLLPQLDLAYLAAQLLARPKKIVGHSDLNLLQLALLAQTQAVTWCGPMACFDLGATPVNPFMWQQFSQAMQTGRVNFSFMPTYLEATPVTLAGHYRGRLWGGNLSLLCSLIGTPWLPTITDGILFLEEVNEHPYRVERMLLQLAQAGILARQQLILVGQVTAYRLAEFDRGYDLPTALARVQAEVAVPIIAGFPFGHVYEKTCLPIGGMIDLTIPHATTAAIEVMATA